MVSTQPTWLPKTARLLAFRNSGGHDLGRSTARWCPPWMKSGSRQQWRRRAFRGVPGVGFASLKWRAFNTLRLGLVRDAIQSTAPRKRRVVERRHCREFRGRPECQIGFWWVEDIRAPQKVPVNAHLPVGIVHSMYPESWMGTRHAKIPAHQWDCLRKPNSP